MEKPRNKLKSFLINVGILFGSLVFLFLILEIGLRLYHKVRYNTPFFQSVEVFTDPELGWKGRMVFGDPNTKKFKIFVVGDSFTEGMGIRTEDMYYSVLGRELDAEIFAYGGYGYGTLQEYMVIDRYIDQIKPDLVILQVSSNDFINNHWELEKLSLKNNNLDVRPYLIDNQVKYKFPGQMASLNLFFMSYSRVMLILQVKLQRIVAILSEKEYLYTVENTIEKDGLKFEPFKESVDITAILIKKIQSRLGNVPIISFIADKETPYFEEFHKIASDANMPFVADIPIMISYGIVQNMNLFTKDRAHWNEEGQQVVGLALYQYLRQFHIE